MYIESISLSHFRNYNELELTFDAGTNLFYGNNAQGKTNILEAVYVCGTSRSHRTSQDREMIQFDETQAHIRMMVQKAHISYRIDTHLRREKSKGIAIGGNPIRKARELLGLVCFVFFSPEDLNIIKNGPSGRRRFLDAELCQLDRVYLSDLTDYNKVVNHRNRLLKDLFFNPSLEPTLDIWDEQLARYGERIIEKRMAFIEELSQIMIPIHRKLTGGMEEISLVYEPDCPSGRLEEKLALSRERDLRQKTTGLGPHRDDFGILVNGMDLRRYGSQGQQRTAALSLKLSEIRLLQDRIKDSPVLLLDDVLSELDRSRQDCLLESIQDIQTLMTCTGLDDIVNHHFRLDKVFYVDNGTVTF